MIDIEKEKLIVEAAKKDLKAFGDLYEIYIKKIYSYVMYMVADENLAEDIVSRTFEKAMLNIDKFEYKGYTFGAWLYRIARNLVYDHSRAKKTVSFENFEIYVSDDNDNPESIATRNEMNAYLLKIMQGLSENYRDMIYLRHIQGYSIKEICKITQKSEDSVKSIIKRAMSKLRELAQENI